jgi:ppGpp synthetase/RelA/SpoT-type nucleotidyltranferase
MTRRLSISQIDKLGRRLAEREPVHDDDRRLLQQLLVDYNGPMESVQDLLLEMLAIESTARLKTEKTIIEKLRRFGTRLSKMQDLAGVRLAMPMTLDAQDGLVTAICGLFDAARVEDRRAAPSAGYRAVHVIVIVDDCPAEIQVRTLWQHAWADLMERLADAVGRGIRYGGLPVDPSARSLFMALMDSSAAYAKTESRAAAVSRTRSVTALRRQTLLRSPAPAAGSHARGLRGRDLRASLRAIRRYDHALDQYLDHQKRLADQLQSLSAGLDEGRLTFIRGVTSLGTSEG